MTRLPAKQYNKFKFTDLLRKTFKFPSRRRRTVNYVEISFIGTAFREITFRTNSVPLHLPHVSYFFALRKPAFRRTENYRIS